MYFFTNYRQGWGFFARYVYSFSLDVETFVSFVSRSRPEPFFWNGNNDVAVKCRYRFVAVDYFISFYNDDAIGAPDE